MDQFFKRGKEMSGKILREVIDPALKMLDSEYGIRATDNSRAMLYAIGLQESALKLRYQVLESGNKGPARGLWQFEHGGGVMGVITHRSTSEAAQHFCLKRIETFVSRDVWQSLEFDDILACIFARLLLWTDPRGLPSPILSASDESWNYYQRNWRPGRPHPENWKANWAESLRVVLG